MHLAWNKRHDDEDSILRAAQHLRAILHMHPHIPSCCVASSFGHCPKPRKWDCCYILGVSSPPKQTTRGRMHQWVKRKVSYSWKYEHRFYMVLPSPNKDAKWCKQTPSLSLQLVATALFLWHFLEGHVATMLGCSHQHSDHWGLICWKGTRQYQLAWMFARHKFKRRAGPMSASEWYLFYLPTLHLTFQPKKNTYPLMMSWWYFA